MSGTTQAHVSQITPRSTLTNAVVVGYDRVLDAFVTLYPAALQGQRQVATFLRTGQVIDPDGGEAFVEAVADELVALPGVPEDLPLYGPEFDLTKLPAHLRMHFRVVDGKGREVGAGDDLEALKQRLKKRVDTTVSSQSTEIARTDLPSFPAGGVPAVHESTVGGLKVTGYPSLVARRGKDGRLNLLALQPRPRAGAAETAPASSSRQADQSGVRTASSRAFSSPSKTWVRSPEADPASAACVETWPGESARWTTWAAGPSLPPKTP
mgnify:CR=1 FL=1